MTYGRTKRIRQYAKIYRYCNKQSKNGLFTHEKHYLVVWVLNRAMVAVFNRCKKRTINIHVKVMLPPGPVKVEAIALV